MSKITESIREEGIRGFLKRWKEGMMKLTPEQLLKSEIWGYVFSILGTLAAAVIFVLWGLWPILLVILFNVWIQTSQVVGKWQQYQMIKKIQTLNIENIMEGEEIEQEGRF